MEKPYLAPGHLSKTISGNSLTLQLPKVVILIRANKAGQNENLGKEKSIRGFEMF